MMYDANEEGTANIPSREPTSSVEDISSDSETNKQSWGAWLSSLCGDLWTSLSPNNILDGIGLIGIVLSNIFLSGSTTAAHTIINSVPLFAYMILNGVISQRHIPRLREAQEMLRQAVSAPWLEYDRSKWFAGEFLVWSLYTALLAMSGPTPACVILAALSGSLSFAERKITGHRYQLHHRECKMEIERRIVQSSEVPTVCIDMMQPLIQKLIQLSDDPVRERLTEMGSKLDDIEASIQFIGYLSKTQQHLLKQIKCDITALIPTDGNTVPHEQEEQDEAAHTPTPMPSPAPLPAASDVDEDESAVTTSPTTGIMEIDDSGSEHSVSSACCT